MISDRHLVLGLVLLAVACGSIACGRVAGDGETPGGPTEPGSASGGPPSQSAPPTPPSPPLPSHCTSGVRDDDESDIDCGGASCAKCGDEQVCVVDDDCRGGQCAKDGVCRSVVVDIAAGTRHTCALYAGGSVRCWGNSERGQLGLGIRTQRGDTPATVPSALPKVNLGKKRFATALSVGAASTCVVLEGGAAKCWGANVGTTGPGTNPDRGIYPEQMGDAMPTLDMGTGRTVRTLASGMDHWCAVLDDFSVKCWGNDFNGVLGTGGYLDRNTMGDARSPVNLGTSRTAKAVGAGGDHTCAVLDDLTLKCWGTNGAGQLGLGPTSWLGTEPTHMGENLPRVSLGFGRTVKQIALGYAHTCAILDDDSLKCWGANGEGQLGLGDTDVRGKTLAQMGDYLLAVGLGDRKATLVATSSSASHTCVLLDDGSVRCFGWNDAGQLGQGDTTNRGGTSSTAPVSIPGIALGDVVTKIAVGNRHACALLQRGAVKCWGDNTYGQLGLGDTEARGDGPSEMGASLPPVSLMP